MDTAELRATAEAVAGTARRENLPFLAGSLAFHAFVSVLPLLLLALVAASVFASAALTAFVVSITTEYLSPTGQELLLDAVLVASESTGGSVVGLLVLLWSASRIFRGVDVAFRELYGASEPKSLLRTLRDAAVGFGAVVLAVGLVGIVASTFALVPGYDLLTPLRPLFVAVALTGVFFPVYYLFPPTDVLPREALPGAVTAAVGWSLLELAFHLYAGVSSYDAYGVLGGVLLLLVYLYFGSLALLLGVVVNVVVGDAGDAPTEAADERPSLVRRLI